MAGEQISGEKTRDLSPIYPSHLHLAVRMTFGFGLFRALAHRSDASYALRVPRAGSLRTASSKRRLAASPLLFG
jgi:hypothetical protein